MRNAQCVMRNGRWQYVLYDDTRRVVRLHLTNSTKRGCQNESGNLVHKCSDINYLTRGDRREFPRLESARRVVPTNLLLIF